MQKKLSRRKKELTNTTKNIVGIIISSAFGFIMTLIATFMMSFLISKSQKMPGYIGALFLISVSFGCILSGVIASRKCNFKGIISGLTCSFPNALLITVTMLFFTNGNVNEKTIFLYLLIILCSGIGGIIGANMKRRK